MGSRYAVLLLQVGDQPGQRVTHEVRRFFLRRLISSRVLPVMPRQARHLDMDQLRAARPRPPNRPLQRSVESRNIAAFHRFDSQIAEAAEIVHHRGRARLVAPGHRQRVLVVFDQKHVG